MRYIRNYDELRNRISHLLQNIYKNALRHCFDATDKEGLPSWLWEELHADNLSITPIALRAGTLSRLPIFTTRSEKKISDRTVF